MTNTQPNPIDPNNKTDRNGNPLVGQILDLIDRDNSRYKVAQGLAAFIEANYIPKPTDTGRTPRDLKIGSQLSSQRLIQMVNIEYGYRMKASEDGTVTPLQIALVLRALADHTTLMAATGYDQRSLEAIREGRIDVDPYWPIETSVGRFLQDTARQIEDGDI